MFDRVRSRTDPYRLYLYAFGGGDPGLAALVYTPVIVYWVRTAHLDPLQLTLLGTVFELTYFVAQIPTGVLADLVSRRLCVIAGWVLSACSWIEQGLSPAYPNLLAAQVLVGLGLALSSGAQEAWIADELGAEAITTVYVRATQFGIAFQIVGAVAAAGLAYLGLTVPLFVGGGIGLAIAAYLAVAMPENNFRRAERTERAGALRHAFSALRGQTRATRRAVAAVPGLLLVFGMIACLGAWSESFDRLWGKLLISDIGLPHSFGMRDTTWFSVISVAVALAGLATSEFARRRTNRLGQGSVVGTLLLLTMVTTVGAVAFAASRSFLFAFLALLLVDASRTAEGPLVAGWMVARIEPAYRATALSAKEMCDSGGEIAGGPVFGGIGNLWSVRVALFAADALLLPALALLAAAARRLRGRPVDADVVAVPEPPATVQPLPAPQLP
jgi:DHA3 family tetracycline resistance protein-like MFS transporter